MKDAPEDRDGLVLLGLVLYNRGNLVRATVEAEKNTSVDNTSTAVKASEGEPFPARWYRIQ